MLVMTGSSRDKLSFLVTRKNQAFYGADITHFPLLDDGFVDAFAKNFNEQFDAKHKFSPTTLKTAFEMVGRRPEMFRTVVAEAVMSGHGAEALDEMVTAGAEELRRKAWAEFEVLSKDFIETKWVFKDFLSGNLKDDSDDDMRDLFN